MQKLRELWRKDPGLVVSGGAHVLALIFLLLNWERPPHFEDPKESIAVEMVTTSELNQIMNGEEHQKQLDKPQRRVDKLAELEERHPANPTAEAKKDTPPPPAPEKPNDDPGHDDKATPPVAVVPPPPPTPTPPERPFEKAPAPPTPPERPVEKVETPTPPERPVEKAEAPTPPEKPDDKPPPPDAEAIAPKPPPRPKLEAKKPVKVAKPMPPKPVKVAKVIPPPPPPPVREPPKEEPKEPPKTKTFDMVAKLLDKLKPDEPPKKARAGNEASEQQPHRDFSFDKITALLDHEAPQHKASTGRQLTQLASLGSPTSHADKMSPSMMAQLDGWLIDHYRGCWSYFGLGATQTYVPMVRVQMAQDGSLSAKPQLLNPPSDPNLRSLADSAMRAVTRCDPLPIPERYKPYYNAWRDRKIRFDPKEMG